MKSQLKRLGLSIDWDKEISTCDENYYKQQQTLFLYFFRKGLAYKKESYVNWDPIDNTVLANEQVVDGKGWRSGAIIEKKKLSQWFLNITKYSEQLLDSLENLKGWPDKVKLMQKNWIGRSDGCEINFATDYKDFHRFSKINCLTKICAHPALFVASSNRQNKQTIIGVQIAGQTIGKSY